MLHNLQHGSASLFLVIWLLHFACVVGITHSEREPSYADWYEMTKVDIFGSQERANELTSSEDGALLSNGRTLSHGCPPDRRDDVEQWGEKPFPQRTKDYHNHMLNSDLWDDVNFRSDDIVIGTCGKSGTTWTQTIVANLVFRGNLSALSDVSSGSGVLEVSPRIDTPYMAKPVKAGMTERFQHRRFLKTHLPLDGLRFSTSAKYIYIVRDVRDVVWSAWNMWMGATDKYYEMFNDYPGLVGPRHPDVRAGNLTVRDFFLRVIDDRFESKPYIWSFFHHIATWWQYKHLRNVFILHFDSMKKDHKGTIEKIARFLDIDATPELLEQVRAQTTLDYMRKNEGTIFSGAFDSLFSESFFNKGVTGVYWRDQLSAEDIASYEAYATARLGPEGARFMMTGQPPVAQGQGGEGCSVQE